jgi:cytochrome c biogenesis protein CcdA
LLLPSFFAYAFGGPTRLLARTGVFFLGVAAVLVPLGAGSGAMAAQLTTHREALIQAAGGTIIALGLVAILGGGWSAGPATRIQQQMAQRGTWMSTAGLGAAYGLAGFCAGPILGAVLTVAAAGRDPLRGAVLLGVYALGITAPLFALAGLWQRCDIGGRAWLRGRGCRLGPLRLHSTSTLSGLLFVALGVVFVFFDGAAALLTPDARVALSIEDTVAALGADVPDTAVLGALAAGVVVIVVWRLRHSPARRPRDGASGSTRTVERVEPAPPSRTQPEDHRTTQG